MKLFDSSVPWFFVVLCAMGGAVLQPFFGHEEGSITFASEAAAAGTPDGEAVTETSDPVQPEVKIVLAGTPEAQDTANPVAPMVLPTNPKPGDLSCNCSIRGEKFNQLSYETPEECGPDRNYLVQPLKQLAKLDSQRLYTETRDGGRDNWRIPRKCFLFAMKHTFPASFKTALFGTCGNRKPSILNSEDFDRTTYKPCITEDLVNVVYNSYLDATDCFQVPPKFAVAKFMNESGVIPNIVATNNDAGLSQFSTGAMEILQETYAQWSPQILDSNRPACRNLLSVTGAMPKDASQIVAKDELKCQLIGVPPNPIRNFIFYGAYYHIVKTDVQRLFNRASAGTKVSGEPDPSLKTTMDLMKDAKIDMFDKDKIMDILQVMAYNTGPKAVVYFREWLSYRIAKFPTTPITKDDLNMQIKPDPWALLGKMTDDEIKLKFDDKGKRPMAFWEWLIVAKDKFRYASFVRFYADRLDAQLGNGICTPKDFLRMDP